MTAPATPQIACHDLTLGYGGAAVLENLNFSVAAGDYLCIVGENGAGKTTLLKALLGLHPPSAGRIEFGAGLSPRAIGYLSQQTVVAKDFPATVGEIVLSGCQGRMGLRPFYRRAEKERAAREMERLGIAALSNACYRTLSGGQQQRVLLARALCAAQQILLLDEPVSGLDPQTASDMYKITKELCQAGMTIMMITHDMQALPYASHVLHIACPSFWGTREAYEQRCAAENAATNKGGEP